MNLHIAPGEIVGLLGPNGSGKSTALRLMLGFLKPTLGRATIAGFNCWAQGVEARQRVAYLPGELRLYDTMTGRRLVTFLRELRGESVGSEVDALAKKLDIDIDRPLTHMSSGMKRKVALLAVLVPKVPLIILDEPTNTLDPTMRDELLGPTPTSQGTRSGRALLVARAARSGSRVRSRRDPAPRGTRSPAGDERTSRRPVSDRAVMGPPPATGPDGAPLPVGAIDRWPAQSEFPRPVAEAPGLARQAATRGV